MPQNYIRSGKVAKCTPYLQWFQVQRYFSTFSNYDVASWETEHCTTHYW